MPASLLELEGHDEFPDRHIGPDPAEQAEMLAVLGLESLDELIDQVVPAGIRSEKPLACPPACPRPRPSPDCDDWRDATSCTRRSSGWATRTRSRPR